MTTLNVHAQESKSRFSCLSAADPENKHDVRKKYEIKAQNTTKTQKSNKPRPPALRAADWGVAGSRKKLVSRATVKGFMRGMHGHDGHRGRRVRVKE